MWHNRCETDQKAFAPGLHSTSIFQDFHYLAVALPLGIFQGRVACKRIPTRPKKTIYHKHWGHATASANILSQMLFEAHGAFSIWRNTKKFWRHLFQILTFFRGVLKETTPFPLSFFLWGSGPATSSKFSGAPAVIRRSTTSALPLAATCSVRPRWFLFSRRAVADRRPHGVQLAPEGRSSQRPTATASEAQEPVADDPELAVVRCKPNVSFALVPYEVSHGASVFNMRLCFKKADCPPCHPGVSRCLCFDKLNDANMSLQPLRWQTSQEWNRTSSWSLRFGL